LDNSNNNSSNYDNNNKKPRKQGNTKRNYRQVVGLPIEVVYKEELVTLGTTAACNSIGDAAFVVAISRLIKEHKEPLAQP
jgi:hypothetical protein